MENIQIYAFATGLFFGTMLGFIIMGALTYGDKKTNDDANHHENRLG